MCPNVLSKCFLTLGAVTTSMGFQCPAIIWVKNFLPILNLNLPWLTSWPFPKSCHWSRKWRDLLLQKRWLSDPASQRDIRHWATWDLKSYTYHQMCLYGGPCHSWCSESSSYQGMSSETWPDQPWASLTNWDWGWGCLCTLLHQLLSLSIAPVSSSQTSQSGAWFLGCMYLTIPLCQWNGLCGEEPLLMPCLPAVVACTH